MFTAAARPRQRTSLLGRGEKTTEGFRFHEDPALTVSRRVFPKGAGLCLLKLLPFAPSPTRSPVAVGTARTW